MIGPRGEKRPDDPIANAVHVARLAAGEAQEVYVRTPEGQRNGTCKGSVVTRNQPHGVKQRFRDDD